MSSINSTDYFTLNFASYSHGYSLHTLYTLTSSFYPTILLLKSLEKKVIIGLYLDDVLRPSGRNSRGKGRSGIFRLDSQTCEWYETAIEKRRKKKELERNDEVRSEMSDDVKEIKSPHHRIKQTKVEPKGSENDEVGTEVDLYSPLSNAYSEILYQYCVCSDDSIIIGGSVAHGTNAIRICRDLKTCSCGPSDTYDNPSLIPEETDPFTIGKI